MVFMGAVPLSEESEKRAMRTSRIEDDGAWPSLDATI